MGQPSSCPSLPLLLLLLFLSDSANGTKALKASDSDDVLPPPLPEHILIQDIAPRLSAPDSVRLASVNSELRASTRSLLNEHLLARVFDHFAPDKNLLGLYVHLVDRADADADLGARLDRLTDAQICLLYDRLNHVHPYFMHDDTGSLVRSARRFQGLFGALVQCFGKSSSLGHLQPRHYFHQITSKRLAALAELGLDMSGIVAGEYVWESDLLKRLQRGGRAVARLVDVGVLRALIGLGLRLHLVEVLAVAAPLPSTTDLLPAFPLYQLFWSASLWDVLTDMKQLAQPALALFWSLGPVREQVRARLDELTTGMTTTTRFELLRLVAEPILRELLDDASRRQRLLGQLVQVRASAMLEFLLVRSETSVHAHYPDVQFDLRAPVTADGRTLTDLLCWTQMSAIRIPHANLFAFLCAHLPASAWLSVARDSLDQVGREFVLNELRHVLPERARIPGAIGCEERRLDEFLDLSVTAALRRRLMECGEPAAHVCPVSLIAVYDPDLLQRVVNERQPGCGNTLLHAAIRLQQPSEIEALLAVSGIDLDARNAHGRTALDYVGAWPETRSQETIRCAQAIIRRLDRIRAFYGSAAQPEQESFETRSCLVVL